MIREAERDIIYSEFSSRDGDVVTGVVQRREARTNTVFIDMGKVEAVLPPSEQSSLDSYRFGERIKVYVLEVKRTTKTHACSSPAAIPACCAGCSSWKCPNCRKALSRSRPRREKPARARRSPSGLSKRT